MVQLCILEHFLQYDGSMAYTSIECSVAGGQMGALGCGLGRGILVVWMENKKFVKN